MRSITLIAAVCATALLGACDNENACTEAAAQEKAAALMAKIQEVGAADPAKMLELQPKLEAAMETVANGENDPEAACKALDDLLAELSN